MEVAEAATVYFQLRAFNGSGLGGFKCASVGGGSFANGAWIVQWGYSGGSEQRWAEYRRID